MVKINTPGQGPMHGRRSAVKSKIHRATKQSKHVRVLKLIERRMALKSHVSELAFESSQNDKSTQGSFAVDAFVARVDRAVRDNRHEDPAVVADAPLCKIMPEDLPDIPSDSWLDAMCDATSGPTPESEAFFADRRRRGLGVGLSEDGLIIAQSDIA